MLLFANEISTKMLINRHQTSHSPLTGVRVNFEEKSLNFHIIIILIILLRFHPKHSDKRQTKARGYSGRKDLNDCIYESEYKAKNEALAT